ncbi:MAG: hypothetical protein PHN57_02800 [Candidatus Omnitrophica bacterium]|nr:hypothetical protein [Candidatus Omnitrophota bacterium]
MRKLIFAALFILFTAMAARSYAAPCYGTTMPGKKEFFAGTQFYSIFKRTLENDGGKIRSAQYFFTLSYGFFDWLSVDLKGGAGDIKQRSSENQDLNYVSNFAGGYGFRLKFLDKNNWKMVFGFQHISVHPASASLNNAKHKAILDDWQTSLLVSYGLKKFTPYLGVRWSRVDYIHRTVEGRKRVMSDADRSIGFIGGVDVPLTKKIWLNLEGQMFDSQAVAASLNYKF